jgi:hypothetical protein
MASKKLTPAQKKLIAILFEGDKPYITNANNGIKLHTVGALRERGFVESYITGSIDAAEYHRLVCTGGAEPIPADSRWYLRLTPAGLTLAESLFGSPAPAPSDTPDSSTPETVAGDTVADSAAPVTSVLNSYSALPVSPVASLPVCDHCRESKSTVRTVYHNSTPVMQVCTDCIVDSEPLYDLPLTPVPPATDAQIADALLPFASFDDSDNDSMPSIPAYTPVSAFSDATQLSSTVKAVKTPVITKKERRKQKQVAIRQQYAIAQRPVANVIQIAEILRSMGIEAAA